MPTTQSQTDSDKLSLSSAQRDPKAAVKQVAEQATEAARGAVASAKETLAHARDEGGALLHDARDAAVHTYESAREHAGEYAHEASDFAQRAGSRTVAYARRTGVSTGRFVSVHALPLALVGASLGWLAWSIRADSRRVAERDYDLELTRPTRTRLQTTLESNYQARRPVAQPRYDEPLSRSSYTTSGEKLLGVRTRENES